MSITSDEVNYLVYRYLVESGFTHTSFAFQYETCIHLQGKGNSKFTKVNVVNGQLIQLLQKGLLFTQVETHLNPVLICVI
jgi:transducin (beta)-like 1